MSTIEYRTIDKSSWKPGPWKDEPDKVQWIDEETNLPCLIKRVDFSGHLCGYVGVGPTHPLHEKDYDYETMDLHVHGGITYNNSCQDASQEAWTIQKKRFKEAKREAIRFPHGDSANYCRKWASFIDNYEKWKEKAQSEFICHIPEPGTSDDIWWFGFDCAHAGDGSPLQDYLRGEYRDIEYVKENIKSLAKQLKALETI